MEEKERHRQREEGRGIVRNQLHSCQRSWSIHQTCRCDASLTLFESFLQTEASQNTGCQGGEQEDQKQINAEVKYSGSDCTVSFYAPESKNYQMFLWECGNLFTRLKQPQSRFSPVEHLSDFVKAAQGEQHQDGFRFLVDLRGAEVLRPALQHVGALRWVQAHLETHKWSTANK